MRGGRVVVPAHRARRGDRVDRAGAHPGTAGVTANSWTRYRIGCAGWSIPPAQAAAFPGGGTHLERYARLLGAVEINSSFHRAHRRSTYERWAAAVPPAFRFAVKIPKEITHRRRLAGIGDPLGRFLDEIEGLGEKLGVLLLQLPPSLEFEGQRARRFFHLLRARYAVRWRASPGIPAGSRRRPSGCSSTKGRAGWRRIRRPCRRRTSRLGGQA